MHSQRNAVSVYCLPIAGHVKVFGRNWRFSVIFRLTLSCCILQDICDKITKKIKCFWLLKLCVLRPQPLSRCLSSCTTKLSTSKVVTDKPVSHYDTGSGWCVPLLYRPIWRLQCYLEADSSWFNLFDVWCLKDRCFSLYSHNLFAVGRYQCWYRGNYYLYRYDTDTGSVGRYPYRSQPNL